MCVCVYVEAHVSANRFVDESFNPFLLAPRSDVRGWSRSADPFGGDDAKMPLFNYFFPQACRYPHDPHTPI